MLRDKNKSEEYFQRGTLKLQNAVAERRKSLQKSPDLRGNGQYIFSNSLCYYITRAYSLGFPVKELVTPCNEMLGAFIKSLDFSMDYSDGGGLIYNELLNMVSLGVLLDTRETLKSLSESLDTINYKDKIIDFLISEGGKLRDLEIGLLWPDDAACKKLNEIIRSDKSSAENGMQDYLENYYYTKENLENKFNSHKKNDNDYDGYWSFESAAIVKIMGLDDSSFRDNPYYPVDMLYEDRSIDVTFTFDSALLENEGMAKESPVVQPVIKKKKWWQF